MATVKIYGLVPLETIEDIPDNLEDNKVLAIVTKQYFQKLSSFEEELKGSKSLIVKGDRIMIHEVVNADKQCLQIQTTIGNIYTDEKPVSFTMKKE